MKTICRLLLLTVSLVCSPVFAAESFSDAHALWRWITYYYTNPEPDRVADALRAASSQGSMNMKNNAWAANMGFIAGVISKNPSMAQSLTEQLTSLPEVDQQVLIVGIWYSAYPDTKQLLAMLTKSMPKNKEVIEQLASYERLSLLEQPLQSESVWQLDALWGYFMATGDEAPVAKIISALAWLNESDDLFRQVIGSAARWSLISNAIQHNRVMTACRKELMSQPKEVTDELREVIAEAEKKSL